MFFKCSPTTIMSSRYTKQASDDSPRNTVSISLSNVPGALQNPEGITLNCQSPCPLVKAVFSPSSGRISICQYPLFKSSVVNHCLPFKASRGCRLFVVGDNCPSS
ncbi:hypothetical protein AVEN_143988-1 [Araneus ventricosus]|uniref:Uncharacterized protein n=1 Tax=Araneus ventricosus TaxID=182803 RepID=A0A4Y2S1X5_ARAVE|nr:hypothetical protein AVEN_143988-1 [Araneus ventricosus]